MLLLGFETASATACVALMQDGALLAEHAVHHTRTHSETVMPMAEALLREMQVAPEDLHAIAVNQGPGSFTGVRIGICIANAMGAALGIPVVGVNALRALYETVACYPGTVYALIDARNDSVYAASFTNTNKEGLPQAVDVETYLQSLESDALFVGDGALAYRERIAQAASGARFAPAIWAYGRAGAICSVANGMLQQGGIAPDAQAAPLYLRVSQAERMWALRQEAQHAR